MRNNDGVMNTVQSMFHAVDALTINISDQTGHASGLKAFQVFKILP